MQFHTTALASRSVTVLHPGVEKTEQESRSYTFRVVLKDDVIGHSDPGHLTLGVQTAQTSQPDEYSSATVDSSRIRPVFL